ncbi:hypothetical protein K7957_09810 [Sphingomonas yunnanensis]|uniref:hypothetical protein n=1 Tax=Sphingomonas yunnanensis TaxID=310400 RepID=UPI001CA66730|nr:hypothetical protein [Sphingomonas yunnanensis]MBY9063228.1 hypothetical protein [Sphingomonas yunnanensis]
MPASARGAYVSVGSAFDAMSALQDVFASVSDTVLIVDAYMDARVIRDIAPLAPEGVKLALLTDENGVKAEFLPICRAWIDQHGDKRPLAVRVTAARVLHDRAVLGNEGDAWILTQSLKDFAKRSPASIQKVDRDIAEAKFQAYSDIWLSARDPLM